MRRKFFIIFFTILIFGIISLVYVENVFLPVQFKYILINQAEQFLGRKVAIDNIHYNLIKGFIANDLVIYQKKNMRQSFIHADQLSLNVLLPNLVHMKRIIIPSIRISNPKVHITRDIIGEWNFSDLLEKTKLPGNKASPFLVFLKNIILENGTIVYADQTQSPLLKETFEHTNIRANISLKKVIRFTIDTTVTKKNASLSFKGAYAIDQQKLESVIDLQNVSLSKYFTSFYHGTLIKINSAVVKNAHLNVKVANKVINLSGNILVDDSHIRIGYNKEFRGQCELADAAMILNGRNLTLTGDLKMDNSSFRIEPDREFRGNLISKDTKLTFIDSVLGLAGSFQVNKAHYLYGEDKDLRGTLSGTDTLFIVKNGQVDLKGFFQVLNANFHFGNERVATGNPSADLHLMYDPNSKNPLSYEGTLHVEEASLQGLPVIEKASDIKGKFEFETDVIKTQLAEFTTLDTPVQLSGALSNFHNPAVDVELAAAETDIRKAIRFIPEFIETNKISMDGQAAFRATYKGPLTTLHRGGLNLVVNFNKVNLTSKKLNQHITNLFGEIDYSSSAVVWRKLRGTFQEKEYLLDGKANLFIIPAIATTIKSQGLDAIAQIKLLPDLIQVSSLEGSYKGMTFNVNGEAKIAEKKPPHLTINGSISTDLTNLSMLFPAWKEKLKSMNPQGILSLTGNFKGYHNDWRNWYLQVTSSVPKLTLYGYKIDDVSLQYAQENQLIKECNVLAFVYGGKLKIDSSAILNQEDIPAQLSLSLKGANLARLKKNTAFKKSDVSGTMNLSMDINGPLLKRKELNGQGQLSVQNGYLWKTTLLPGILKNLLLPKYRDVIFTDATADFVLANDKVETNNFMLYSAGVDLLGQGWIDLDKNIDFAIYPKFKRIALAKTEMFGDGLNLLSQAENLFVIKLSGTLNKPNYAFQTGPERIIEKTTNFLIDGVKEIWQGIF